MRHRLALTAYLLALALAAAVVAVVSAPAHAAAPKRLTPTRKAAVTASLIGTAAVADAPWNALMGAGDISAALTDTNTRDYATSEIMRLASPGGIFADGDTQYPSGDLADFQSPDGYSGSWGRPEVKGSPARWSATTNTGTPHRGRPGSSPTSTLTARATRTPNTPPRSSTGLASRSPRCTPTGARLAPAGGAMC